MRKYNPGHWNVTERSHRPRYGIHSGTGRAAGADKNDAVRRRRGKARSGEVWPGGQGAIRRKRSGNNMLQPKGLLIAAAECCSRHGYGGRRSSICGNGHDFPGLPSPTGAHTVPNQSFVSRAGLIMSTTPSSFPVLMRQTRPHAPHSLTGEASALKPEE